MSKFWAHYNQRLNTYMIGSIGAGALLGYVLPEIALSVALVGELFLRTLTLLIVPVIVVSMLAGILNLSDSGNLGRLGLKTILYYTCTTGLAVFIGLSCVNIIQPGLSDGPHLTPSSENAQEALDEEQARSNSLADVVRNMVPRNVVQAAAEGNVLGLIFFTVFLGVALLHIPHEGVGLLKQGVSALFEAIIWMVDKVMLIAPLGILSLVGNLVADFVLNSNLAELGSAIGWYSLTVVVGLLVHALIGLPLLASFFQVNVLRFGKCMLPAVSTAFSTASSAATLPVTIDSLEHRAGVSNKTASFVAPLGATVNMDGTAIYEAVAAVFIANMYGVDLTFSQQLVIFLTATFSAVGAAGIPGAGLIMMTLVLGSVGLPVEGIQLVVVVDRALDMLRTAVNVWGDSLGAAIIAKTEGEDLFGTEG